MLIIGTKSGYILLVTPTLHSKILHSFLAHSAEITKIEYLYKYDPIQKQSATISDDGTLQIWDILTKSRLHLFAHSKEPLRALALTKSNPDMIATGSLDGFIRVYDIGKANAPIAVINTHVQVNCLIFPLVASSGFILSAGKSTLSLWNVSNETDANAKPIQTTTPHHMQITDICASDAFDNGERVIFTAGLDGMVKVVSLADFREIHKFEYPSSLTSIRVLPNCRYVIVGANNNSADSVNCIYTRKLLLGDEIGAAGKTKEESLIKEQQKILDLTKRFSTKDEVNGGFGEFGFVFGGSMGDWH